MTPDDAPVLSLDGAWKAFGHVVALANVSLDAFAGEIVAIVGDNGAGKSTLVKCISGVYALDAGTLTIRPADEVVEGDQGPRRRGLSGPCRGTNLGRRDKPLPRASHYPCRHLREAPCYVRRSGPSVRRTARGNAFGAHPCRRALRWTTPGGSNSADLTRDCPIVIFDEPTAALGVRETAKVGDVVRHLRDQGKAVVLISHDLEFVFKCSDRMQVMRLGRVAGRCVTRDVQPNDVVALITGASSFDTSETPRAEPGHDDPPHNGHVPRRAGRARRRDDSGHSRPAGRLSTASRYRR